MKFIQSYLSIIARKMQSQSTLEEKLLKNFQDLIPFDQITGLAIREQKVLLSLSISPEEIENKRLLLQNSMMQVDPNLLLQVYSAPEKIKGQVSEKIYLSQVRHLIAVSSGKGGVGKSTIAVNLAFALSQLGHKVALLDADIYGPSIPHMLGLDQRPRSPDGKKMSPIMFENVECMSMGLLMPKDQPAIWRGPMVMKALTQMLGQVYWSARDIMIIDMPPGTGDVQLTLAQKFSLAGAIIVSTPQDLALIDARKGLKMFQTMNTPILGIVENMSTFACPHCGEYSSIFDQAGAKAEAEKCKIPFLGEVPLHMDLRASGDKKLPFVLAYPESSMTKIFHIIGEKIMDQLSAVSTHVENVLSQTA